MKESPSAGEPLRTPNRYRATGRSVLPLTKPRPSIGWTRSPVEGTDRAAVSAPDRDLPSRESASAVPGMAHHGRCAGHRAPLHPEGCPGTGEHSPASCGGRCGVCSSVGKTLTSQTEMARPPHREPGQSAVTAVSSGTPRSARASSRSVPRSPRSGRTETR